MKTRPKKKGRKPMPTTATHTTMLVNNFPVALRLKVKSIAVLQGRTLAEVLAEVVEKGLVAKEVEMQRLHWKCVDEFSGHQIWVQQEERTKRWRYSLLRKPDPRAGSVFRGMPGDDNVFEDFETKDAAVKAAKKVVSREEKGSGATA